MKTGLFFGSFNPIHIGHLIIANIMAEHTDLQRVWFVVSPQNPFKPAKSLLHEFDRYEMVRAAVADHYKLDVSDAEFHLPKPSYTAHTLAHFTEKHPAKEFKVIVGEDNLQKFGNWRNHRHILEHYGLYVYPRPHAVKTEFHTHPNVKMVQAPLIDISATYIRGLIRSGRSIRYLVPEPVEQLIQLKHFYREG